MVSHWTKYKHAYLFLSYSDLSGNFSYSSEYTIDNKECVYRRVPTQMFLWNYYLTGPEQPGQHLLLQLSGPEPCPDPLPDTAVGPAVSEWSAGVPPRPHQGRHDGRCPQWGY